ncbi:MAG: helix-turn-helix transcriptional regulator [Burkholderiaceae bacterium]|nr:helix-turn-helix transcriptional regulator [Burkholderiaceae bacterium]
MNADLQLSLVAGAIADPARARMLCCLMDGHARTATELATVGEVGASTASSHLARLRQQHLVEVLAQGKHRYFKLASPEVARALEALLVLAGVSAPRFKPSTPQPLRLARRCYDHLAGRLGVLLHEHAHAQAWLSPDDGSAEAGAYALSEAGEQALQALGVDVMAARTKRRRFACACLDWSERKPHLGGALGAAWLQRLCEQDWLQPELDSRGLRLTRKGQTRLAALLDVDARSLQ